MAGVPKSESPTVYMTGGGPAAGKSVALLKNPTVGIPGKSAAVHADPDGAKESIPEFSQNKHSEDRTVATRVHEESAAMSQMAVREALRQGRNVVYDSSGDGGIAKLEAKVATMRENGAERVIANYVTIDIKDAIRRSDERAKTEGRFVPHAYLEQVHRDVTRTTIAAIQRGVYDSLDLWDNSGKTVVHVASYTRGTGLKVIDQSAWDSFQKRGE
jgi:predicted ABC-type ATPase